MKQKLKIIIILSITVFCLCCFVNLLIADKSDDSLKEISKLSKKQNVSPYLKFLKELLTYEKPGEKKKEGTVKKTVADKSPLTKLLLKKKASPAHQKTPTKITGSVFTEYEYVDIDNYLNNTSYDRGPTYRFGFVGLGNIGNTKFSGLMIASYNNIKAQKKVEFESLRFIFSKENRSLLIGQYYPQYSEFTMSNQKIEGIKFTVSDKIADNELTHEFFAGISNQYEKITDFNTTSEYQQYMYGSRLQYIYKKDNIFNFTIFKAMDDKDSIDTGTPTFGLINNDVLGFEYIKYFPKEKGSMTLEYSKTSLDRNINFGKLRDEGIKYLIDYNFKKNLITSLQYKKFGKNYYSAGNTSLNSSEVGYNGILLNYGYEFDKGSCQGFLEGYSEYGADTSEINTDYKIFNNILNYKLSSRDRITFTTYFKETEKEDKTIDKFKTSFKLGYSMRIKKRRIGIKTDYSKTEDKILSNSDVITKGFSLTYNDRFFKNRLSLSSFLLGSITSLSSGNTKFYMANTNFNATLIPRKLVMLSALNFKLNISTSETTRTYTNKFEFKYYLTLRQSLKLILKNDRKIGGTTEYNVNDIFLNSTFLF